MAKKDKPDILEAPKEEDVSSADMNPEQIAEAARSQIIEAIQEMSVDVFKKNFADLYERIIISIQGPGRPKGEGFLLDVDDPYAAGVARTAKLGRLPVLIPYKASCAKAALENYILRAAGAGDTKRAEAARQALKKVK